MYFMGTGNILWINFREQTGYLYYINWLNAKLAKIWYKFLRTMQFINGEQGREIETKKVNLK